MTKRNSNQTLALVLVAILGVCGFSSRSDDRQTSSVEPKTSFQTPSYSASPQPESLPSKNFADTNNPKGKSNRTAAIIGENVSLRRTPNSNGKIVQMLPEATEIEVIRWKRAWFYVSAGGQTGWLHGSRIRFTKDDLTSSADVHVAPRKTRPAPEQRAINNAGATANCRDVMLTYSADRRGTCSHHGGVAVW